MPILTPEFRIVVYKPKDVVPITINKGVNGIKSISSTRSITGEGSVTITFNETKRIEYKYGTNNEPFYSSLARIFTLNTIISVQVKKEPLDQWRQINLVYVDSINFQLSAIGQFSMSVTFPTLEKKFREAQLFVDYVKDEKLNTEQQKAQKQTIEASLANVADTLGEYKTVQTVVTAVWDKLIVDLMQVQLIQDQDFSGRYKFGGKYFIGSTTEDENETLLKPEIMSFGITTSMVQVFELATQISFGETVSFWQTLTSMLTEPFYELFIDTLETIPSDEGYIEEKRNYKVPQGTSKFVFRLAPFRSMFGANGEWQESTSVGVHKINLSSIKNMTMSVSNAEIYCGCHVGLTVLDTANLLIVPVKWNNVLRAITGTPKVLQIKLSGLGFDADATKEQVSNYTASLRSMRDLIYGIFFNPKDMKIARGQISTAFDYYRVGKPFLLEKPLEINEVKMPSIGYITSVSDKFEADGKAESTIEYKWSSYNLLENT
jgi:hypothetical protein